MEQIKKFLSLFSNAPVWVRAVVTGLVAVGIALYLMFSVTACGITQTVNNIEGDGNSTTMEVNPSQSSSTSVSTDLSLPLHE